MPSTRHIGLLAVSCIILAGCANQGVPSGLPDRVWVGAVVGVHGNLLDLTDRQVLPLGPFVKSVVGDDAFGAYHMPGDELRLSVFASIRGRFLACKAWDASNVCIIDVSSREFSIVPSPEKGLRISLGGWNRDESSLLCFCYRKIGDQFSTAGEHHEGYLYLLRHGEDGWSWVKLTGAGEVSAPRGICEVTAGAWADDSRILFSSDGRIMRFDMRSQVLESGPEGEAPYSFGKDNILWQNVDSRLAPFAMARWDRSGKVGQIRKMMGDRVVLNGWPHISPNGDLVLFTELSLTSVWGHAAFSERMCLYDVKADRFYRLPRGTMRGARLPRGTMRGAPVVDVVTAAGVWIRDDHGLRDTALDALSRK